MTNLSIIRIGTRKSALALAQANEVLTRLTEAHPHLDSTVEIVPMMTRGDSSSGQPLSDIGGKGLFTKEIEEALLSGSIDMAVHSMKDMPTQLPHGLTIGCMLEREDPCDMLVGAGLRSLDDLMAGATFGTSSLRRAAQILMARPDVKIVPMRGNVETRLAKVQRGEVDATMLAKAGINRLGIADVPGIVLGVNEFLPAVAQGAIGVECREEDGRIMELLSPLADIDTETAVICERAFLGALDGSCRTPIAGYAEVEEGMINLMGLIAKSDGSVFHTIRLSGNTMGARALGEEAGRKLLEKAGPDFLK